MPVSDDRTVSRIEKDLRRMMTVRFLLKTVRFVFENRINPMVDHFKNIFLGQEIT
jgi:hypothetical protein